MPVTEPYPEQVKVWPKEGRHVLAQFDPETVVVYQAYKPVIGRYAAEHGAFGGEFSYARMSWVKTNFLWMMYRSGWGTKENREVTLALRLRRTFFDSLLAQAVPSRWDRGLYPNREDWSRAVGRSENRLQFDPDPHSSGAKLERRAIQLGLRGSVLEAFGRREMVEVVDLSGFVAEQRAVLAAGGASALITPRERVYTPADPAVAARLGLSAGNAMLPDILLGNGDALRQEVLRVDGGRDHHHPPSCSGGSGAADGGCFQQLDRRAAGRDLTRREH